MKLVTNGDCLQLLVKRTRIEDKGGGLRIVTRTPPLCDEGLLIAEKFDFAEGKPRLEAFHGCNLKLTAAVSNFEARSPDTGHVMDK